MGRNTIFIFLNLLICFWIVVFSKFQDHFSKPEIYSHHVSALKSDLESLQLELDLYREQVLRYQVEVSAVLPNVIKGNKNRELQFPLRTLASTLPGFKNERLELSMLNKNFYLAKKYFNEKNYKSAIEQFSEFISRTPFSANLVEANFLLAESYFQIEDFENCLLVIEKMIEQFPSSEMTGYSMIRMGKIYELQDRPEEAVEVYRLVSQSFSDRGIASQAAQSMRDVEL